MQLHPVTYWVLLPALAAFASLVTFGLFKSAAFRVWFGGALSAFIDGFIEGAPIGSPSGGVIAAADGQVFADLGSRHILIELAHVLAVPFFTGLADVRSYKKANPFPNIFDPLQKPIQGQ